MKLLVFGSCVSRDILRYDYDNEIKLSDYYARCSLVSLFSAPCINEHVLQRIESNFQRRMVRRDMDKSFLKEFRSAMADMLLVDFIDERFSLHLLPEGCLTLSSEYRKALGFSLPHSTMGGFSDKKLELWRRAFDQFLDFVGTKNILINRAYWTDKTSDESTISHVSQEKIREANSYLSMMYDHATSRLGLSCFIDHDPSDLYCDVGHKWGVSPFHYNENLYKKALRKILTHADLG